MGDPVEFNQDLIQHILPLGILITDKNMHIISWNAWLEEHSGIQAAQILGRNLFEVFPDLDQRFFTAYQRVLEGQVITLPQQQHQYFILMPGANGQEKMRQSVKISPLYNDDAQIAGTITIIEDVTKIAEAETILLRRINDRELMQEVSRYLLTLDLTECLNNIVKHAAELVGAPNSAVFIIKGDRIELKAWYGNQIFPDSLFLNHVDNIVRKVIAAKDVLLINDLEKTRDVLSLVPGSKSVMGIPLKIDGEIIGVLLIESPEKMAFREENKVQAVSRSVFAAVAIKNAQLFSSLEEKNRENLLLNDLSASLQKSNDIKEALYVIGRIGREIFPDTACRMTIMDKVGDIIEESDPWGDYQENILPVLETEYNIDGDRQGRIFLQIEANNKTWKNHAAYAESKKILFRSFSDHVSSAVVNLKLRENLVYQAMRDCLTGLYNRRYMEESLEREIDRARRFNTSIAVIMLDLDCFKKVNDAFGHEAGDYVLQQFGHLLQNKVRKGDIPCRYGGEEFVIIMIDADLVIAVERAEMIRNAFKNLNLNYLGTSLGMITVSTGVAVYPQHGSTSQEILRIADRSLYLAKVSGRDRTVYA